MDLFDALSALFGEIQYLFFYVCLTAVAPNPDFREFTALVWCTKRDVLSFLSADTLRHVRHKTTPKARLLRKGSKAFFNACLRR